MFYKFVRINTIRRIKKAELELTKKSCIEDAILADKAKF